MSSVCSIPSCPEIQEGINTHFKDLTGAVPISDNLVPFLLNPINTDGTMQRQISPGGGKLRTVELVYPKRAVESEVSTSAVLSCAGGDAPGECTTQYTIDPEVGVSVAWSVTPADLVRNCRANQFWVEREILRYMDVLVRRMGTEVANQLILNVGVFLDDSTSKNTSTKNAAGGDVYNLIEDVTYHMRELEYTGPPFVFGDGELYRYMNRILANCCSDAGFDLRDFAAQNRIGFLADKKVRAAAGSEGFVALAPGAVQLITYNEFLIDNVPMHFDTAQLKQTTLMHPQTGLQFDFYAEYSCGVWNFQLKLAFDTVYLPTDLFQVDDPLYQTNWILRYNIVNP